MTEEAKVEPWRERMRVIGKEAFQLEEMLRLGFWPLPEDPGAGEKRTAALAELQVKGVELNSLRTELTEIDATIQTAKPAEQALKLIRQRRIERSQARRAERREARLEAQETRQE